MCDESPLSVLPFDSAIFLSKMNQPGNTSGLVEIDMLPNNRDGGGEAGLAMLFLEYASAGKFKAPSDAEPKLTSSQFVRMCQDVGIGGRPKEI